jgi:hypothetical protein
VAAHHVLGVEQAAAVWTHDQALIERPHGIEQMMAFWVWPNRIFYIPPDCPAIFV